MTQHKLIKSHFFVLFVAVGILLLVAIQLLLYMVAAPQGMRYAATSALFLGLLWFPLSAAAWLRLRRLRERAYAFADAPPDGEEQPEPVEAMSVPLFFLRLVAFLDEMNEKVANGIRNHPFLILLLEGLVGLFGGIFTVGVIEWLGAEILYPWHALSFMLGFTGMVVLSELVVYVLSVLHFFHYTKQQPDPSHPDGYGGFGLIAEDANSLVAWLFVLLIAGNGFFLTHRQVQTASLPSRSIDLGTILQFSVDWPSLATMLSVVCTTIVFAIYLLVYIALVEMFARNRSNAIVDAEKQYRANRDESSRKTLEMALEMRSRPAAPLTLAQNAGLAFTALVTMVLNVQDSVAQLLRLVM